jgi:hypothetical protein
VSFDFAEQISVVGFEAPFHRRHVRLRSGVQRGEQLGRRPDQHHHQPFGEWVECAAMTHRPLASGAELEQIMGLLNDRECRWPCRFPHQVQARKNLGKLWICGYFHLGNHRTPRPMCRIGSRFW